MIFKHIHYQLRRTWRINFHHHAHAALLSVTNDAGYLIRPGNIIKPSVITLSTCRHRGCSKLLAQGSLTLLGMETTSRQRCAFIAFKKRLNRNGKPMENAQLDKTHGIDKLLNSLQWQIMSRRIDQHAAMNKSREIWRQESRTATNDMFTVDIPRHAANDNISINTLLH